jgi:hypothetical protein
MQNLIFVVFKTYDMTSLLIEKSKCKFALVFIIGLSVVCISG